MARVVSGFVVNGIDSEIMYCLDDQHIRLHVSVVPSHIDICIYGYSDKSFHIVIIGVDYELQQLILRKYRVQCRQCNGSFFHELYDFVRTLDDDVWNIMYGEMKSMDEVIDYIVHQIEKFNKQYGKVIE